MVLIGTKRAFRAAKWASISHSAEIGPSWIFSNRCSAAPLSAAALEWGKFSELIKADTRLSYREIKVEYRVRAEGEECLLFS